jgi:hypothetical protein
MRLTGKTQAQVDAEANASALRTEQTELLAYLDASRYHLDIAQETGVEVWPEVRAERAAARTRISAIRKALEGHEKTL